MLSVTKAYMCSALMEYVGLEKLDGVPTKISSLEDKDLQNVIGSFVDEYVMVEFDVEKALRQQKEQAQQNGNQPVQQYYHPASQVHIWIKISVSA